MNALIEEYLRIRGVRYFRGHHEDEYFFLVDSPGFPVDSPGAHPGPGGKMHVRLAAVGGQVRVTVTPDRYYPAGQRDRLAGLAARWAPGGTAEAVLHDSCDPALVGVVVRASVRPDGIGDLTAFVDRAVASAVDLFAGLHRAA